MLASISRWLLVFVTFQIGSGFALAQITINEIYYRPPKTEATEFIELYNAGPEAVDVSGWKFSSGIKFTFPAGTTLKPDGYWVLASNTNSFRGKFGVAASGQFSGKLSRRSEKLVLQDAAGKVQDEADYRLGFPWPTVDDAVSASIELVHSSLDNSLGGSWRPAKSGLRGAQATPGAKNSVFASDAPPQLRNVTHSPPQPRSGDGVRVSVRVSDPDGVGKLTLEYQAVDPGRYIEQRDAAYRSGWVSLPMRESGQAAGAKGAREFAVELPADLQKHRRLVRYRIRAEDAKGQVAIAPYPDDPSPNFAYFVYDGVPAWRGAVNPKTWNPLAPGVTEFSTNVMRSLPTYHIIAKRSSVEAAQWRERYPGDEYKWTGTLVYDGKVYDHVRFRARGGAWRYAMGKNMWKFDFNLGHEFQAKDNWGQPYREHWSKLNLGACIQQADFGHRGEQGMFEAVGFRLFNLAGVEAPNTHWVQLRVIDEAEEYRTQYDGDFWGLYLAVEQPDGHFLNEHALPDGNFYKMEGGTGELNNHGLLQPSNKSDLNSFMRSYQQNPPEDWWRKNLDLDRYYGYRAIVEYIHHYDIDEGAGKNYFYFRNPTTGRWSVHPWDIDLTWADSMYGGGRSPFSHRVLPKPAFTIEYQNRLREVHDLLFNTDQAGQLIDEYAALIADPKGGPSMVQADRAMWDNNPVMSDHSRSMPGKSGPGLFYGASPTGDFAGMVQLMKNYVNQHGRLVEARLANDRAIPKTPTITYAGPKNFSTSQLRFQSSPFSGSAQFAAIQWRLGEVTDINSPAFNPRQPRQYEITAAWQSEPMTKPDWEITIPPVAAKPGYTYRARVRVKDATGRWSHWSAPAQFAASE